MSVIWAIGVLALLFVTYVAAARYRSIESTQLAERVRAEELAKAAVSIALLDLLADPARAGSPGRFRRDGTAVLCTFGSGSRIAIAVADEGGKIDLNSSDPALLQAVTSRVAPDTRTGALIAKSILAMRAAAAAAQRAQGIASPDAPAFRTVFELDQVPGVDRGLLRAMMPLVTAYSGSTGFDPQVAPMALLAAVAPDVSIVSRAEAGAHVPPSYLAASAGKAFVISGEVVTGSGGRFSQEAVVELSPELATGYTIREWRAGSRHGSAPVPARLSPC